MASGLAAKREKADYSDAYKIMYSSLFNEDFSDEQRKIIQREKLKETLGNMTLIHYGVNMSMSNKEFIAKREAFFNPLIFILIEV